MNGRAGGDPVGGSAGDRGGGRPGGRLDDWSLGARLGGDPGGDRNGGTGGLTIGGWAPLSTCDWPGKLVATVFLQGCPWDCTYCHNPGLIPPRAAGTVAWSAVIDHVERRRGLLDGVVFSGGEATRQDLAGAIRQLRRLGMGVGVHTSGAYPQRLARLLPLVDWVGFDVKALPDDMPAITRRPHSGTAMAASLELLLRSGVAYQVRTTWGPGVMDRAEAEAVLAWARAQGATDPVLQEVRSEGTRPEFQAAFRRGG